jgi:hypothetical protein
MQPISYARHRFPPDVIRHANWTLWRAGRHPRHWARHKRKSPRRRAKAILVGCGDTQPPLPNFGFDRELRFRSWTCNRLYLLLFAPDLRASSPEGALTGVSSQNLQDFSR